jgi:predicted nucleotidyltransferase component of viral defense system
VRRLRDHPDDLYALVSAASDAMRIPVEFVEKDFWVTELLRTVVSEAAAGGAVAVFKGGTSLSKAYRIVERFSEDVDILLVPPAGLGTEARHRVLKRICRAAAAHFGLVGDGDVIQSETGIKRNVRFDYLRTSGCLEGPFETSDRVLVAAGSPAPPACAAGPAGSARTPPPAESSGGRRGA